MQLFQSKVNGNNPVDTVVKGTSRAKNYNHFSSKKLIDFFATQNLNLEGTSYGKVKKIERDGFQKHIMIFSNDTMSLDDGNSLQLLVTNSHDGKNSVVLNLGIYRAVCANGLVVGDTFLEHRVRHTSKDIYTDIYKYAAQLIAEMPRVKATIKAMQSYQLSQEQVIQLESVFIKRRLKDKTLTKVFGMHRVLREADKGNDLYTVFNKFQEKIINGGIKFQHKTKTGEIKSNTTRKIKSIQEKLDLNKFMYSQAVELMAA